MYNPRFLHSAARLVRFVGSNRRHMQLFREDLARETTATSDPESSNDVQGDWEDVSDAEETSQHETIVSGVDGAQAAQTVLRKKRRVQPKNAPAPSKGHATKGRKKLFIVKKEVLQEVFTDGVRYTALYAFDVVKGSIEKMRKPLPWFLFLYMFAWLASRAAPAFRMAFSPLCVLPVISKSTLCAVNPPFVNFEKLVNVQGATFEQLIGESAGGSQISTQVLRTEMAAEDLSLLVLHSDLASKDTIADVLHTIGMDAKRTGRGLSKLDAKVVGAIDKVMAVNNYAMATIEDAQNRAPSWLLQAVSPIKLGPTAEEIITEAFTLAVDESERTIEKLKDEADISWRNLEQLDVDIGTLHELITREDKHASIEKDELLGHLWTKLGGNTKAVRDYRDRLSLLDDMGEYRKQAAAHVKAALRALYTMSDDLEVLREKVAAPGLLQGKLPLHVHIESIRSGLERLQEGRMVSRGRRWGMGIGEDVVSKLLNGGGSAV